MTALAIVGYMAVLFVLFRGLFNTQGDDPNV